LNSERLRIGEEAFVREVFDEAAMQIDTTSYKEKLSRGFDLLALAFSPCSD
jgi:hypothetical protein